MKRPVVVFSYDSGSLGEALAGEFDLPLVDASGLKKSRAKDRLCFYQQHSVESRFLAFIVSEGAVRIALIDETKVLAIEADFTGATVSYRRKHGGGSGQMIAKAVGIKSGYVPAVLDATAGLGGDAFVLASLGCEMTLIERVPSVRAILRIGLQRAKEHQEDAQLVETLERMNLLEFDSRDYLKLLPEKSRPDVIYLDPMFPERTKSAAVKKEMRVFHELVGADSDACELLPLALESVRCRVVVKRPRIAPVLAGASPSYVLKGKSNRFDIYVKEKLPDS
ncbi:MAG: class I SAM-dependent methyltransferase [Verrucomicrobiota bacterium]